MNVILIRNRSAALFVGTRARRICDENCANGENFAAATAAAVAGIRVEIGCGKANVCPCIKLYISPCTFGAYS